MIFNVTTTHTTITRSEPCGFVQHLIQSLGSGLVQRPRLWCGKTSNAYTGDHRIKDPNRLRGRVLALIKIFIFNPNVSHLNIIVQQTQLDSITCQQPSLLAKYQLQTNHHYIHLKIRRCLVTFTSLCEDHEESRNFHKVVMIVYLSENSLWNVISTLGGTVAWDQDIFSWHLCRSQVKLNDTFSWL